MIIWYVLGIYIQHKREKRISKKMEKMFPKPALKKEDEYSHIQITPDGIISNQTIKIRNNITDKETNFEL